MAPVFAEIETKGRIPKTAHKKDLLCIEASDSKALEKARLAHEQAEKYAKAMGVWVEEIGAPEEGDTMKVNCHNFPSSYGPNGEKGI